ncbi:MAG: hypothetical protein FWD06_10915 [Oscillospiraceae bacterium]|nr:hypothetical protein [Oscillospiraceae bacterium]
MMKKILACGLLLLLFLVPVNASVIAAGSTHNVAAASDGSVWAWGQNRNGQIGDGTRFARNAAVQVPGISNVRAVAAGNHHTVALRRDGTVMSWGANALGQLGNGTTTERTSPVRVQGLTNVTAISSHDTHNLALRNDGTVWAWGSNTRGELGHGSDASFSSVPVQVVGLENATAIAAGWGSSFALRSDGQVVAWGLETGSNVPAQVDRAWDFNVVPAQVSGLRNVTAFSENGQSVAVTRDGTVWQWGHGQRPQRVPVQGVRLVDTLNLREVWWPCWRHLPGWVQFLLRWVAFGWVWM